MSKNKTNREMSEQGAQFSLGKFITGNAERDAVHIAVLPVISGADYLYPGEKIKFAFGTRNIVIPEREYNKPSMGIVDPFLLGSIKKGQSFYMFMQPNTITGLHHQWSHPSVDAPIIQVSEAEAWLRNFADKWSMNYNEMIEGASENCGYVTAQGVDLHSAEELGDDCDLFWQNLEAVTGKTFSLEHRGNMVWSCSC